MDIPARGRKRAASEELEYPRKSRRTDQPHDISSKAVVETNSDASLKRKASDSDSDSQPQPPPKRVKNEINQKAGQPAVLAPIAQTPAPAVPPTYVRPVAPLMTIEPEVRIEILKHLLLLERNQVVEYTSAPLTHAKFATLAKDPYASKNKYDPGDGTSEVENDTLLRTGLQREIHYRPDVQILRVCKKLNAEGEDIFYNENNYIGVHEAPSDFVNNLRTFGITFRRWRGACDRLMAQPVLQIDFRPAPLNFRPDRWLLFPPSELRRLALTLYNPNLFMTPNMTFFQRLHLRITPGLRLLKAFRQKEIGGVKDLVQHNLIDRVGNEFRGCLADGMRTPSWKDRMQGRTSVRGLRTRPSDERMTRNVRQIRDVFEETYEVHITQGLSAVLQDYIDLRDKIWLVCRNCHMLRHASTVVANTEAHHLICMLSWIFFLIASASGPKQWRVLFAQRALTLPSYIAATEWKIRIHVLVAGILQSFPGLRNLRVHHLVRGASLLELTTDNPLSQQLCGLQAMVLNKTSTDTGVEEIMVLLQKGLKVEMERKYGEEMVIPHSALDDELAGLVSGTVATQP